MVDVDLKTPPYNAKILPDYETLRTVYSNIQLPGSNTANNNPRPDCKNVWPSISAFDANQPIPAQPLMEKATMSSPMQANNDAFE